MTQNDAYKLLCKENEEVFKVSACLDFGKFYAFSLMSMDFPSNEACYSGTYMTAVDKKTGRIFDYNILDDIDAYNDAKEVQVDTIWDKEV